MPAIGVGPQGVTTISPPSRCVQTKVVLITPSDADVPFEAFALPKDSVIIGVAVIALGANATQAVSLGFSSTGTEIVNEFAPNAVGYVDIGSDAGSAVGTKLTADKKVFAYADATLTSPVIIKVEYYIAPAGQPL